MLCISGWPWTHDPPALASWVLGKQPCSPRSGPEFGVCLTKPWWEDEFGGVSLKKAGEMEGKGKRQTGGGLTGISTGRVYSMGPCAKEW